MSRGDVGHARALCTHAVGHSRNTKDKSREHLQSTFRLRTYQAALREGFFGKSCRRRWALIPLPECHGVVTDQKFPGRLRGWRMPKTKKKRIWEKETSKTSMHTIKSQQKKKERENTVAQRKALDKCSS